MALKLKVLKNVLPPTQNQVSGAGEGRSEEAENPGPSSGPVQAEPRRRDHIYNQSALQGW